MYAHLTSGTPRSSLRLEKSEASSARAALVPLKYESLKEETRKVGKNGYVGVSRRRLAGARGGGGDEEDFVVVERGFFDPDGRKQWSRFVTLPADPKVVEWLGQALKRV